MTLANERNTVELDENGKYIVLPVAAGKKIYAGSMVAINASGYALPAEKAEGLKTVGRAETSADNSSGPDGYAAVNVKRGVFFWDNDSENAVVAANLFGPCYIKDDCTVSALSAGSSPAGKVIAILDGCIAVESE